MHPYRIAFSDMDGTLLTPQHKLSQATISAVNRWTAKGLPFVLVSARSPKGMLPTWEALCLDTPIISYSGAYIFEPNGAVINSIGLTYREALEVKTFINEQFPSICCTCYAGTSWIVDNPDDPWVAEEASITGETPIAAPLSHAVSTDTIINKVHCMGKASYIAKLKETILGRFPKWSVTHSKDTYLEIASGDCSKAKGAAMVCDALGLSMKDAVAFGDYDNDIALLKGAGLGIAMENAPNHVKQAADKTAKPNWEDGMAQALDELILG